MSLEQSHDELLTVWMPLYLERARENNWRALQLIETREGAATAELDAAMKLYFQHVRRPRN